MHEEKRPSKIPKICARLIHYKYTSSFHDITEKSSPTPPSINKPAALMKAENLLSSTFRT